LAAKNNRISIVTKLLDHGANIDFADSSGHTPLAIVSRLGNINMVKLLISRKANVSARSISGITPLAE
jgi:ankyrin repeat protein